jgi:hypothetical protein
MKRSDLRRIIREEVMNIRIYETYENFDFYLVYGIPPNVRLKIEDLIFEYMPTGWVNGKAGVRITEKRVAMQILKALETKGFTKMRIQKVAGGVPKDPTDDFKNMFK